MRARGRLPHSTRLPASFCYASGPCSGRSKRPAATRVDEGSPPVHVSPCATGCAFAASSRGRQHPCNTAAAQPVCPPPAAGAALPPLPKVTSSPHPRGPPAGPQAAAMSSVSPLEHTAIGAMAGVLEVSIMQARAGRTGAHKSGAARCRRLRAPPATDCSADAASLAAPASPACSRRWASRMRCRRGGRCRAPSQGCTAAMR